LRVITRAEHIPACSQGQKRTTGSEFHFRFICPDCNFVCDVLRRNEAQPDKFSSIPATMWWGISTLTTVGYGDIVPITGWGKFLGGIFAMAGVGLLALPAGILSSGFFEMLHHKNAPQKSVKICPHCGKEIHD
jgi:predicted RNA-binding Zn-ribbon protein involved in translation (DUF1610 family)